MSTERFVVASGLTEDGVIAGNLYDKYGSRNPIVRALMGGFSSALNELVEITKARVIHEVGCGEGHWTLHWTQQGKKARGTDFSGQVIEMAEGNAARQNLPATFRTANIYDLNAADDAAELVVCCEVLEHLEDPRRALRVLTALASPWLILSVPREPIWSVMNMARGKYWSDLGNTPGHIQRWSTDAFKTLIGEYFEIVEVRQPLPWTMALCRRRQPKDVKPAP